MQLSIRLDAVAKMAAQAKRLADIGTDHAYIPIYLMQAGSLESAVAMDINPGPLARAQENIRAYGLEDKIRTRLSDGAQKLRRGEADTVVIAGMGGALMQKILTEGARQLQDVETFVLQPQSELAQFRRFLQENGFCITDEAFVKDGGKYYPMMTARRGAQESWSEAEYLYGKFLIAERNACLMEYLRRTREAQRRLLEAVAGKDSPQIRARKEEIFGELALIEEILQEELS